MCGIAGYIHGRNQVGNLAKMADVISHRGPDDVGSYSSNFLDYKIGLVHRRLSIVDLTSAGHQPMARFNDTLILSFNGEIYNFLELRRILTEVGYNFTSNTDSEIILVAYHYWGRSCVNHFHGMFAFAIWDCSKGELFLARDRLGKKPLFYFHQHNTFVFASEIKSILVCLDKMPSLDYEALDDYLTYLYVPYPKTIFQNVKQLPPATMMAVKVLSDGLSVSFEKYWDPLRKSIEIVGSISEIAAQLNSRIADAVSCRLVSDVPLGVLLSGGLDSSTITAKMAGSLLEPVRTFSVGFLKNEAYDEIPYAKLVSEALNCQHEVLDASSPDIGNLLAKVVWHFDQPFGNPTAILTYVLSELTRKHVTVALAGDGGDEIFGGYPRYVGAYFSKIPRSLPGFMSEQLMPLLGKVLTDDTKGHHQFRRIREFLEDAGKPLIEMYLKWIGYFSEEDKIKLRSSALSDHVGKYNSGQFLRNLYNEAEMLEPLNRLAYVDLKSFLCCNVLEYSDRMSMAHALELRAPFTDHRLVEFMLHIPFNLKFRNGYTKWILKKAVQPFLPNKVLNKQKIGFNPPLGSWLGNELRPLPEYFLSEKRLKQRGFFQTAAVQQILYEYYGGRRDNSLHIWALLMLELWCCLYMDGQSVEEVQELICALIKGAVRRPAESSAIMALL